MEHVITHFLNGVQDSSKYQMEHCKELMLVQVVVEHLDLLLDNRIVVEL